MSQKNMLPKDLNNFILISDYTVIKILFHHQIKQRYVLLIENKNFNKFVLKWNSMNQKTHLNNLNKEILFYKKNLKRQYIPTYISSSSNHLICEYYESKTLREYLVKYISENRNTGNVKNEFKNIIKSLMNSYQNMVTQNSENITSEKNVFTSNFSKLMYSVPNNENKKFKDKLIAKLLYFQNKNSIATINSTINSKFKTQILEYKAVVHGDFHLNNIIVTNNTVKFIDWENHRLGTSFEDITYCMAFILKILENDIVHYKYVLKKFFLLFNLNDAKLVQLILDYYLIAISVNRNFSYTQTLSDLLVKSLFFRKKIREIRKRL